MNEIEQVFKSEIRKLRRTIESLEDQSEILRKVRNTYIKVLEDKDKRINKLNDLNNKLLDAALFGAPSPHVAGKPYRAQSGRAKTKGE